MEAEGRAQSSNCYHPSCNGDDSDQQEFNLSEDTTTILIYSTSQCLLQINVFQLFRNPAGKMIICNVPKKNKHK